MNTHNLAVKHGWTGAVEYCDLAKILRLPGTTNWKQLTDPKPVALVDEHSARFDPAQLDEFLPHFPYNATSAIYNDKGTNSIVLNPNVQISNQLTGALCELHPRFAATWNHRRNDLKDQSCSGYDLALANMAVLCGLTNQQIADLLVVHRREFPGKRKTRRGSAYIKYLTGRISLARAGRKSSEAAAAEWEQFHAALEGGTTASSEIPPEDPAPEGDDGEHST
jgi:hypothetical protein